MVMAEVIDSQWPALQHLATAGLPPYTEASEKKKADAAKPGANSAKEIALHPGEVRPDVKNHA